MEKQGNALEQESYYKYRSLDDLERILDIIVNNRLYAAVYKDLNDPMEGKFNKDGLNSDDFTKIYSHLKRTRICSLLKKQKGQVFPDDYLMWSHYANSHSGCCVELNITKQYNNGWDLLEVSYQDKLPEVKGEIADIIRGILSVKTSLWENEHEVRAIKIYDENKFSTNSPFYHIKIKAIYFGCKVSKEKCDFYKKIISSINRNIKIYRLKEKSEIRDSFPKLTPVEL
jgi:hypothetical protein